MDSAPTEAFAADQSKVEQDRDPLAPKDQLIGTTFEGKYKIEIKLGEGGMGAVYRATHIFMERPVAIKFLHGDRTTDTASIERFKVEARAAGRLQHPNATAVTDFGVTQDNIFYLVMEYLEGRSLRDKMRQEGQVSLEDTAKIIAQVCDAVEAAHKRNIIHRDLKPDNIFLQKDEHREVVKVLDFGIAKITQSNAASTAGLTSAGMIVGTPYYMSPEQCQGDALDSCADIYSLGVIIFEMVTGKLPFTGESPLSIVLKHVSEAPPNPKKYRSDLPDAVEEVILKALSKRKQDRQQSATKLANELIAAVGVNIEGSRRHIEASDSESPTKRFDAQTQEDFQSQKETRKMQGRSDLQTQSIEEAETVASVKPSPKGEAKGSSRETALIGKRPADGKSVADDSYQQSEIKTTTRSKAPIFIGLGGLLIAVVIVVFIFYKKEPAEDPNKTPLSGNIGNGQTRENPAAESLLQMISIRGGTFTMGREPGIDELSGDKIKNNETPTNEVTVSDFSISKYEVTNSEYFEFVKATNHRPPKHWKNGTFEKGKEDFPVVNVSLDDVNAFCKWLSDKEKRTYRLPTEEEWEFAARGTDSLLYPWGSSWEPLRANTAELGKIMLSVKSDAMKKDTSPYGVIGMSGNVTEWTSSKYKLYKGNSSANSDSGNRVVRGSNFASPNYTAVTTTRFSIPSPEYLDVVLGFRVARDGSK